MPSHFHLSPRPTGRFGALGLSAWLLISIATGNLGAQEPPDTNYDEAAVRSYELPDPLTSLDGRRIENARLWCDVRRPEILEAFRREVYGRVPEFATALRCVVTKVDPVALGGLAIRKEIRIDLFEAVDAPHIDLLLYIPAKGTGPFPTFLGLNYGNQGVADDPAITPSRNAISKRGEHAHRWPLAHILSSGYAVATFHGGDVELDRHGSGCRFTPEGWERGVRYFVMRGLGRAEFAPDEWGSIAAWAWALSRSLDCLETDDAIDAKRVAVIGHSRTGKAALWAAAQDDRFAMAAANQSGRGGAAIARRRYGETVKASYDISGSWYCRNYKHYGGNESALPVDAHLLIAAIAPRPVAIGSAVEDRWADPRGEFLAARAADPAYGLFGVVGVGVDDWPPPDHPVGDRVGYRLRPGGHEMSADDWDYYLRFFDRQR